MLLKNSEKKEKDCSFHFNNQPIMKRSFIYLSALLLTIIFTSCQSPKEETAPKKKLQLWETKTEDGWKSFRKVNYTYNDEGLLIEEKAQKIVSEDSLVNQFRLLTQYNSEGKMLNKIREIWKDGKWTFGIQNSFTYENDQVTRRKDSMIIQGQSKIIHVIYEYDSEGNLLSETGQESLDNPKPRPPRIVYKNNKEGKAILKEFPKLKNGEWVNSRKMTLKYNKEGHHIETIRYNWKDSIWQEFVYYELNLDSLGTRLSELWKRSNPEGRKEFMRITYTYD